MWFGIALDANKLPLANAEVSICFGVQVVKFIHTDDRGFYTVQLHLHDPDWGKRIRVKAEDDEARIKVVFDRGDQIIL